MFLKDFQNFRRFAPIYPSQDFNVSKKKYTGRYTAPLSENLKWTMIVVFEDEKTIIFKCSFEKTEKINYSINQQGCLKEKSSYFAKHWQNLWLSIHFLHGVQDLFQDLFQKRGFKLVQFPRSLDGNINGILLGNHVITSNPKSVTMTYYIYHLPAFESDFM